MLTDPINVTVKENELARIKSMPMYWFLTPVTLSPECPKPNLFITQAKHARADDDGVRLRLVSPKGKRYAY